MTTMTRYYAKGREPWHYYFRCFKCYRWLVGGTWQYFPRYHRQSMSMTFVIDDWVRIAKAKGEE